MMLSELIFKKGDFIDVKAFVVNIEEETLGNDNFRKVLWTGQHSQLVLMSLNPGEDIGAEVHEIVDQFFRVDEGEGKVIADGQEYEIRDGYAVCIPAGTEHNIINTSADKKLKLYTIYSPAHHKDKVIHVTKAEAMADTEDHI